jgi:hypothetical protein
MARGIIRIGLPPKAEIVEEWIARALKAAATRGTFIIKTRTARGVDADGKPFKPYSRRYQILKVSTGRSISPPDLTLSGAMLGNLKILRVQKRQVVIGFEGTHRRHRFSRRSRKSFVSVRTGPKVSTTAGKRTLKRTTSGGQQETVPMAKVVLGNDRVRPFFHLRSPADRKDVIGEAQAELDRLIRDDNARR